MPQKQIVKFGEVPGIIVSLAAGVFVQLNQQWLGDHPRIVTALYAVSLMLVMRFLSRMQWMKRLLGDFGDREVFAPTAAPNTTATANGNRIEQHFYGVVPSPAEGHNSLKTVETDPEYPNFHWRFRHARVLGTNNIWRESDRRVGYQSLLVDISAELPESGIRVRKCTLYGAVMFAGVKLQNTGFLNRLCWIGEPANEMDFEVGKSATLFVLCFESDEARPGPEWKAFQCKLNRVPDHPFYRSDFEPYRDFGRMTIPIDGSPTVKVSLVDAYTGHVVETREVRLKLGNGDWEVEEV